MSSKFCHTKYQITFVLTFEILFIIQLSWKVCGVEMEEQVGCYKNDYFSI